MGFEKWQLGKSAGKANAINPPPGLYEKSGDDGNLENGGMAAFQDHFKLWRSAEHTFLAVDN